MDESRAVIDSYQRSALAYFERHTHARTGLVADSSGTGADASIAGSGMALSSLVVAAERGWIDRAAAAERALMMLRFLAGADSSGTRGFYFHFLDPANGTRAGKCEVSTMDSALLFAGALTVSAYFTSDTAIEAEVRSLGEELYLRADWQWASPRPPVVSHGWTPEHGFLPYDWRGYNEALLLYILALGSPTYPVASAAYDHWLASYKWKSIYGHQFVYGGPLFVHQIAHSWIDFRGIQDSYVRERGIDYFENSRRATFVQREYAVRNPRRFAGYGENCWGVSASTGPASGGRYGYRARGVPFGPDDGTIAPFTTAASLPFAPEIVIPALAHAIETVRAADHGSVPCFNLTHSTAFEPGGWRAAHNFAIDEGPVVLMLENFRSGLIWKLLSGSPHIRRGLERAGFSGGWLESA